MNGAAAGGPRRRWTLHTWCCSSAAWKVAADCDEKANLRRCATAARTPKPHLQCERLGSDGSQVQILARRPAVGRFRGFECAGDAGQNALRVSSILIVITSPPSGISAPLQQTVHRPASASSCTWSNAAGDGRADCPSSGPHWPANFSAAAAAFCSSRALLRRLALRSTAWHARSYMYSMSSSLASKPSIEHVQCAWHEVRLGLRGGGDAQIAC